VRNDVPGGDTGLLVPPPGVAKAGGARARVLIERLRAQIRALEQVPVSLASPRTGRGPSPPRLLSIFASCWSLQLPPFGGGISAEQADQSGAARDQA